MRRVELIQPLPAPAVEAWEALIDTPRWPEWGVLVTAARGEFVPGSRWTMTLQGERGGARRTMRPRFVSMAGRQVSFETRILGGAVRILHVFDVEASGDGSVLKQTFEITGPLAAALWGPVRRGAEQFEELGRDLARRLGA